MAKRSGGTGGTPATDLLDRLGASYRIRAYRHDPTVSSYGLEAAEALGADPARVFKTLLVSMGDGHAVGVVPVSGSLDLKALAAALGAKRAAMADPADAERLTGYVLGGISPIGQRRRLPTVIDESVWRYASVLVSGGRRGLDLELAPDALVAATHGVTATIARLGD